MTVSVVIPNFNGKELLLNNLRKVILASGDSEIVVVDDASTDGSVEMLRKEYPEVKIIARKKNGGFASAVNEGVDNALGEFVYLLNSDAVPQKGYLDSPVKYFKNSDLFAVGSLQLVHQGADTTSQGRAKGCFRRGFLVHSAWHGNGTETLWVFGGAGLFRRDIWIKLGGMTPLYNPFYWEDIDLSYRALKSGYQIVFDPESIVHHFRDKRSISGTYNDNYINSVAYRNQILFVWLNITDGGYLLSHFFNLPYHILKSLLNRNFSFLRGMLMAFRLLPDVFAQRRKNKITAIISDKKILDRFDL